VVGEDLRKYLPKIACPTQVVWGEHDPILPLSLTKVYRDKLINVTVRVVWGAGHDPHLTHYDQTLAILQEASE
jgi:pimeloyl-ACP methyl ester carboxylesterase